MALLLGKQKVVMEGKDRVGGRKGDGRLQYGDAGAEQEKVEILG